MIGSYDLHPKNLKQEVLKRMFYDYKGFPGTYKSKNGIKYDMKTVSDFLEFLSLFNGEEINARSLVRLKLLKMISKRNKNIRFKIKGIKHKIVVNDELVDAILMALVAANKLVFTSGSNFSFEVFTEDPNTGENSSVIALSTGEHVSFSKEGKAEELLGALELDFLSRGKNIYCKLVQGDCGKMAIRKMKATTAF